MNKKIDSLKAINKIGKIEILHTEDCAYPSSDDGSWHSREFAVAEGKVREVYKDEIKQIKDDLKAEKLIFTKAVNVGVLLTSFESDDGLKSGFDFYNVWGVSHVGKEQELTFDEYKTLYKYCEKKGLTAPIA